jgi:hypothetical protein
VVEDVMAMKNVADLIILWLMVWKGDEGCDFVQVGGDVGELANRVTKLPGTL